MSIISKCHRISQLLPQMVHLIRPLAGSSKQQVAVRRICNSDKMTGSTPVHTWHRCQLCGHITLCADLLPGGCGKMKPPKLSEKRVVFIFWSASLLKVWVVSSKHIQVGAVSNTAVSTSGRGHTVSCGTFNIHRIFESLMQLEIIYALIFSNAMWLMLFSSNIGLSYLTTNTTWQTNST